MYVFLFVIVLLTPLVMICFGGAWQKNPPAEINDAYGYRTKRSMASKAAWDYAHRYSGRIWFWAGLGLVVISIAAMLFFMKAYEHTVLWLMIFQVAVILLSILPVERALKKNFDENGNPKQK